MSDCLLAIDLSTSRGDIAVVNHDGSLRFERDFTSQRSHNSQLYGPLADALAAAGTDLRHVLIGTGPGSYTGVRMSIAAAHGIALSKGATMSGLASVLALSDEPEHLVIGDARRGLFHATHVLQGRIQGQLEVIDAAGLTAWLTARPGFPCFTSDPQPVPGFPLATRAEPSAARIARLAWAQGWQPTLDLEPLYVQEAFITKAAGK
jgi:tRNA threonylcarbamoyladenosine biosynthesis protein TsaB